MTPSIAAATAQSARRSPYFARALEGIDDLDAAGLVPVGIVPLLFGQDRILRPLARERLHDERIGYTIACPTQSLTLEQAGSLQVNEKLTRGLGDMARATSLSFMYTLMR